MTAPRAAAEPSGYRSGLLPWWSGVNQDRTGDPAGCAACDIDTDLVLIWKRDGHQVIYWHDLVRLCRRCAGLVDSILNERGSTGGRWSRTPRNLAVESAVLQVMKSRTGD